MKKSILILFCLCSISLFAQKSQADKKFNLYQYSEAIPLYKQYLEKHSEDYDASKNLALSYKYTNNINGSVEIYRSMLKLKQAVPEDWYELSQLLKISGNLSEAKVYAIQYQQKNAGEKALNLIKSIDMYDEFMSGKNEYDIANKTSQYPKSVFASIFYQNGFIVTAESEHGAKNDWTGRGFSKLFSTDANFDQLVPFATEVMSAYNDGPATLSSDGKTMYFTTINKKSLQEEDVNTRKLQISSAILKDGKWEPVELFKFNNSNYNFGHPALKNDGSMLVFSSDKPGGKGKMDLYYCLMQKDNTWSEPINIAILNTSENEIFPTFDASNNLYFASNGLPGIGGLDIFISKNDGINFTAPVNLKAPINSSYDDFFLSTNTNLESGYISTNRFGTTETDDIAYFSRKVKGTVSKTTIKINVLDKYTSIPLPYVTVSLKDDKNNIVFSGMTDPNGILIVEDMPADNYKVQGLLNDITTSFANITKDEFANESIEKTLYHNDPRFTLSGIAVNSLNGPPVAGVKITCENTASGKVKTQITKEDGKFFFQLEQASDFKVMGEKQGWLSSEAIYETTKGLDRSKDLYVKLKLSMQQPTAEAVIRLDKIYYDYDKCDIKPRAAEELNRLIKLMNDFPDMIIELSSHTDSRGSNEYNLKLSQCRADAAVVYILSKGIAKDRIVPKGYGETKLVNRCADGVDCTEAEHQENRRTEFKIITCPSCPKVEK
jgi:outer membrane protein OmpA-like peptidoglycan-associated protein